MGRVRRFRQIQHLLDARRKATVDLSVRGRMRRLLTPARIITFLSAIIIPVAGLIVATAEPHLVADIPRVDQRPVEAGPHTDPSAHSYEPVPIRMPDGSEQLGISIMFVVELDVRNVGLKAGPLDRVDTKLLHRHPYAATEVEVVSCDRDRIGWRERRLQTCRIVQTVYSEGYHPFEATFVDSLGRTVTAVMSGMTVARDKPIPDRIMQ